MQQKWISKLLGYDFLVEYKRGSENRAADVLSRRDEDESPIVLSIISVPTWNLLEEVKQKSERNPEVKLLLQKVESGETKDNNSSFLKWSHSTT